MPWNRLRGSGCRPQEGERSRADSAWQGGQRMSPIRIDPTHPGVASRHPSSNVYEEPWPNERISLPGREDHLSVVVPAKNEAESLPQLVADIVQALRPRLADR